MYVIKGALGAYIMMTFRTGALYPTCFMITELTALTDNMNWYTKTLRLPYMKEPHKSLWRSKGLPRLRAASFILFRVWVPPFVIIKSATLTGGWLPLAQGWLRLKWYVSIPGFAIILLFSLLNFAWTWVITMKCFKAGQHLSPRITGYDPIERQTEVDVGRKATK